MSSNITVVINAYNEQNNIVECIKSAKILTSDILVVDTESSDKTAEIADREGARVVTFPYSLFVEVSRGFSIARAKGPWVFLLDGDERLTESLAAKIKSAIKSDKYTYYKIPRKNFFYGRQLKHGGWYPDYVIKLINKKFFQSWPKQIHSAPKVQGECGIVEADLLHFSQPSLSHMVNRTIVYEDTEADLLHRAKREANTLIFFRKFFGQLFKRLILKSGWRDGHCGIIESIYQAYSKTITYLYLYEKNTCSKSLS